MGGGASKSQSAKDSKALNETLQKFNPNTMGIFRKMNIGNDTLNCLWKTFHAIACMDEVSVKENGGRAYEDHEISYQEFHDYYDLGTNHFSKIVFSRMDYGGSGEINFEEYVYSIWDFLTNDLHHFVFQVFDKDDSNFLTLEEMEKIMMCSYGVQIDEEQNGKGDQAKLKLLKKTAANAVNIADRNKDGKITFEEYEFFTKANGIVEHPGSDMQEKLCKANGGYKMWNALRKYRFEHHRTRSIHKVLQSHSWVQRDKKRKHKKKKDVSRSNSKAEHDKEERNEKNKKKYVKRSETMENRAATKIQAIHRGRTSRKSHHHGKDKDKGKKHHHD